MEIEKNKLRSDYRGRTLKNIMYQINDSNPDVRPFLIKTYNKNSVFEVLSLYEGMNYSQNYFIHNLPNVKNNLNNLLNIMKDRYIYETISKIDRIETKKNFCSPQNLFLLGLVHRPYKEAKKYAKLINQKPIYSVIHKKESAHSIFPILLDLSRCIGYKDKRRIKEIAKIATKSEDKEFLDNLRESLLMIWYQSYELPRHHKTAKLNIDTLLKFY